MSIIMSIFMSIVLRFLLIVFSFHLFLFCINYSSFSHFYSSATNRLIPPKDHASVQLSIGEVDSEGRYTGKSIAFALSGAVRFASEADNSLCRLATEQGILKSVWSAQN